MGIIVDDDFGFITQYSIVQYIIYIVSVSVSARLQYMSPNMNMYCTYYHLQYVLYHQLCVQYSTVSYICDYEGVIQMQYVLQSTVEANVLISLLL